MQTRQATQDLIVYTLDLRKHTIPTHSLLEDFRTGHGHQGLQAHNPNVASFHYEGRIYFNLANEIVPKTRIVRAGAQA